MSRENFGFKVTKVDGGAQVFVAIHAIATMTPNTEGCEILLVTGDILKIKETKETLLQKSQGRGVLYEIG